MKALKLVLVVALVSFAMMSYAHNEVKVVRNVIQLKVAMTDPALCAVIMTQVNPVDLFRNETTRPLCVTVFYRGQAVAIIGSYSEWFSFFKLRIRPGIPSEFDDSSLKKIE